MQDEMEEDYPHGRAYPPYAKPPEVSSSGTLGAGMIPSTVTNVNGASFLMNRSNHGIRERDNARGNGAQTTSHLETAMIRRSYSRDG